MFKCANCGSLKPFEELYVIEGESDEPYLACSIECAETIKTREIGKLERKLERLKKKTIKKANII